MRRVLLAILLSTLSVLGWASSASAHADLIGSTPESGASLTVFPSAVTLNFSETVDVVFVNMELSSGTPDAPGSVIASLDRATKEPGASVEFRLPANVTAPTQPGAYFAHWRYYGLDGHTMEGYVSFNVGATATSATPPTIATASPDTSSASQGLSGLYPSLRKTARLVAFLGAALLVGAWFWSRQRSIDVLDEQLAPVWDLTRRTAAVLTTGSAALVAIVSSLSAVDAGITNVDSLARLISSQSVLVWVFAAIAAALSFRQWLFVTPAAVLTALAAALSSHAVDQNWVALSVLFSAAHLGALFVWAGPLFALGWLRAAQTGFRAHPALPTLLRDALVRYSTWAQASIGVVVVSGVRQALVIADGVPAGTWGQYLVVKLGIAALSVVPFGVFHHLAIRRAHAGGEAMPVLRTTLWLETAGVVLSMIAAAALAATAV